MGAAAAADGGNDAAGGISPRTRKGTWKTTRMAGRAMASRPGSLIHRRLPTTLADRDSDPVPPLTLVPVPAPAGVRARQGA